MQEQAMFRRLYFLLPNALLTQDVVDELRQSGISKQYINACSHEDMPMGRLPQAGKEKIENKAQWLENVLWNSNLILFFVAFSVFIFGIYSGEISLSVISFIIMMFTFGIGDYFALFIPRIHINEFEHAISHNEILLMVDVPEKNVAEIESFVHKRHPAVIEGGSSWAVEALGL